MKRKQPRQELKPKRRQRVTAEQLVSAIIEAYVALDYLTCLHNLRSFTTFSCGCESD